MQHGLAMEPDDRDVTRKPVVAKETFGRLRMGLRHQRFGLLERARPRIAVGKACGIGERPAQQLAFRQRIGPARGRPEARNALPVGLDQRDIHAVDRGPAHQADGTDVPHAAFLD